MDILLHDLRYAARSLRRSTGFTLVAVLTLALGIGATTSVFSMVNGVLLHPLPFAEQERLFLFNERSAQDGERLPSYPNFLDWQRQATVLDIAYARGRSEPMRGSDGIENVLVAYVSPHFLSVLGAGIALGRMLLPDEERAGGGSEVVITHHFWMQHFGGDPAAVGRTLILGDRSYTVAGDAAWGALPLVGGHLGSGERDHGYRPRSHRARFPRGRNSHRPAASRRVARASAG